MLYLGLTQLYIRWKQTVLMAIQIATVMVLGVFIITTYQRQSAQYTPFKEFMEGEGVAFMGNRKGYFDYGGLEGFLSELKKVEDVSYVLTDTFYLDEDSAIYCYAYDDMTSGYVPQLADGVWYTEVKDSDMLEVVATGNINGVKVGNEYEIATSDNGNKIKIRICGILENGASYYDPNYSLINSSVFDFFSPYDFMLDDMLQPMFFFSQEEALKHGFSGIDGHRVLVKYQDDITEEEIVENERLIISLGGSHIFTYDELRARTEKIIMSKVMVIAPVGIGVFLLVSFGNACLVALDVKANMKRYAIYYSYGMTWKRCMGISMVQSIGTGLLGFILAILTGNLIILFANQNTFFFEWGFWQLLACLILLVYLVVLAMIIPVFIFRKNVPVNILRNSKV